MSKKKKDNKANKDSPYELSRKRLLPGEYKRYRLIGEPNLSQNWLELFTPATVSDLFTIMHSCSDNTQKKEYIREEMSDRGFEEISLGTNIYVMENPAYPGVVFKFALDDCGLADNFNDVVLENLVNECLGEDRYTHTLARHPSGIVSVQERKIPIRTQDRLEPFRGSILKALRKLEEEFLIIDLSPSLYQLNYAVDRNGSWCFIDASDLYPLINIKTKIRCHKAVGYDDKKREVRRCGGRLSYTKDYSAIVCNRCGMEYLPSEIRPNDKEDVGKMANAMMDGMTAEEREEMRRAEMVCVMGKMATRPIRPELYENESDPDPEEKPVTVLRPATKPIGKPSSLTVFIGPDDEETQEEDGDESFTRTSVREPDDDVRRETRTPFFNAFERSNVDESEEDSDDGDGGGEDGDRVETVFPHEIISDQEARVDYTIIPVSSGDRMPGILMNVHGDFNAAFENTGLPILITLDDANTVHQIISIAALKYMLKNTLPDIIEEYELVHGEGSYPYTKSVTAPTYEDDSATEDGDDDSDDEDEDE